MRDVLVVGLGAMGSATLHALASRGVDVVGVDAYDPPHSLGSTHGRSRIIREAYYEHPAYVPLVRSAYAAWGRLEAAAGVQLFLRTGGLNIGAPDSALVAGALASAARHGLDVEVLTAREINRRHPAFAVPADMVGVFEPSAGMLFPEACITAFLRVARGLGADVRPNTRVTALERFADGIRASTSAGDLCARRVVICAGPWTAPLLSTLGMALPLVVTRQTMHWFMPAADASIVCADRLPVALIEHDGGHIFYAMPDVGDGVKAAIHHDGAAVDVGGQADGAVAPAGSQSQPERAGVPAPLGLERQGGNDDDDSVNAAGADLVVGDPAGAAGLAGRGAGGHQHAALPLLTEGVPHLKAALLPGAQRGRPGRQVRRTHWD